MRNRFYQCLSVASIFVCLLSAQNEIRFTLTADPKTFNPLLADDENATTILYLTCAQLIRVNRLTQAPEPELADSWKTSPDLKSITFHLRPKVSFSDGTPFTADDVAYTLRTVTDPNLHSPHGDAFPATVKFQTNSHSEITITFPTPQTGIEAIFDQLPILSAKSPKAGLGPFTLAQHNPGIDILLKRNPHYWKKDAPHLDSVRLYIQQNKEIQFARFRRKEIHLINNLDPANFKRLSRESPTEALDLGPSFDVDFAWFNLVPIAPIPAYKKGWFQSRNFRLALNDAINREDLCRIVYLGYAKPALGPFSPANVQAFWFNQNLKPQMYFDFRRRTKTPPRRRLPTNQQRTPRQVRQPGRVFPPYRRQEPRIHGRPHPTGPQENRHPPQPRHARIQLPHRTHRQNLQLRSRPLGLRQRRP